MFKAIVLIAWGLVIVNFLVVFPAPLPLILKGLGAFLVVAHLAEYFIFNEAIKAKGDSAGKGFLMTFVFGVIYIKGL